MKITIIGAGIAGLTFGAQAVRDGHEVIIYEKNSVPGGVVAALKHGEYTFEQGPLLIGDMLPGEPIYEFLDSLGIHLETERADRDIILPDYEMKTPEQYKGPYWRRDRLKELFPEEADALDRYYEFYDDVIHFFYLARQKKTLVNIFRLLRQLPKVWKYINMDADALTKSFFKSEKIRILYTGILADFCADPREVQGPSVVISNYETAFDKRIPLERDGEKYYYGYCYVKGGCQKITDAIADYITENGGKIIYNTVVEKVNVEDGRVRGVRLASGEELESDIVVGCGAAKDFFNEAVGREHLDKKYLEIIDGFTPMEAVFMVHLGVDYDPMQYLNSALTYCYGMYDLSEAAARLRRGEYHEGDDGYLIFVPSAHAPEFAPKGKHCVTIYTVAPDKLAEGTWEEKKDFYAEKLIKLAEKHLPDLSEHITAKKIMTAVEYREFTHMKKSSFGGAVPIWKQPKPKHVTPVKGLYFIGQQSQNLGGLGNVLLGAQVAYKKATRR